MEQMVQKPLVHPAAVRAVVVDEAAVSEQAGAICPLVGVFVKRAIVELVEQMTRVRDNACERTIHHTAVGYGCVVQKDLLVKPVAIINPLCVPYLFSNHLRFGSECKNGSILRRDERVALEENVVGIGVHDIGTVMGVALEQKI